MTYASIETSVETGQPIETYKFTVGAQVFRLTSTEQGVSIGSEDFDPLQITRGNLEDDADRRDQTFQVTMPASHPLPRLFLNVPPGQRVTLLARRFHSTDGGTPGVVTMFDGLVHTIKFRKHVREAILTCLPEIMAAEHDAPRFTYQASCNHVLYHPTTCKVDPTDPLWRASSYPVTAQVGRVLTVPGLSTDFDPGWFIGGMVEVSGANDFRMVLDQVGDDLYLLLPFSVAPTLVTVFAGCDHSDGPGGCPKFSNGINYGGFVYVSTKNPYESGLT